MDVDDVVRIALDHLVADHLHVACEHHEADVLLLQELHLLALHLLAVGLVRQDAPHVVGDAELVRDVAQVFVVGDDAGDVHVPFARTVAGEQVVETVAHLAHEDGHARLLVAEIDVGGHLVALLEELVDDFLDMVARNEEALQLPLDAHEQMPLDRVHVLVEIDDVSVVARDESRHVGDDALTVGTVEQ